MMWNRYVYFRHTSHTLVLQFHTAQIYNITQINRCIALGLQKLLQPVKNCGDQLFYVLVRLRQLGRPFAIH